MYLLPSSILNKYTERVNSKSGYYKIPYESWRLLKKLASSDLIFEVETKLKNGEIHLCLTSDSLHYEIPVTYGFVNVMTDTNSTYPMPAKKKTALNMNFDFGPINEGVAISPYGLAILAATAQTVEVTDFITKIVSFLNFGSSTQPFGNIMVFNEDEDSTFGNMDMSKLLC